jgi:predicted signal transduction protein with EAL and GGDEF domain
LKTIAEGIESSSQKAKLQYLGCEMGQGYHFARPLRAADMNEFLKKSERDETLPIISIISNGLAMKNAVSVGQKVARS